MQNAPQKNKMMDGKDTKNKSAETAAEQEYHLAGGLEYEPITIKARSREEAEEIWQRVRKKVDISNQ